MNKKENQPFAFPEEIEDEVGTVIEYESPCPGVYEISALVEDTQLATEYYLVALHSPHISDQAKKYGTPSLTAPDWLLYPLEEPDQGKQIIQYEIQRYRKTNHLPLEEMESLLETVVFGREYYPEYFGEHPVPLITPRGFTLRYKAFMNGVFVIETDQCEKFISVCYPIWACDYSDFVKGLGEQTAFDLEKGIDQTYGYLFFPEEPGCLAIFELRLRYGKIKESGLIDPAALMNAIWERFPAYAAAYNIREQTGRNDALGLMLRSLGWEDVELSKSVKDLISLTQGKGTDYLLL